MVRIPEASEIEQVPAGTLRAPLVRASGDDFGTEAAEVLAGLVKTGLDLAARLAKKRQTGEYETFVTASMAERRQLFGDLLAASKDEAGDGAEFTSSFDGKLDDSIPSFIENFGTRAATVPRRRPSKRNAGKSKISDRK